MRESLEAKLFKMGYKVFSRVTKQDSALQRLGGIGEMGLLNCLFRAMMTGSGCFMEPRMNYITSKFHLREI